MRDQKNDVYEMTGAQKTREYNLTGDQKIMSTSRRVHRKLLMSTT